MKFHGKKIQLMTLCFLLSWFLPSITQAQLIERPDNPALKPLNFGLSVESDDVTVSPNDNFWIVNDTDQIVEINTANFELFDPQPEVLESRGDSYEFLPNSVSLFVHEQDGFITRIIADDPLNDLLSVDLSADIEDGVGDLVMDPESIDRHLYVLNFNNSTIFEYNISSQSIGNSVFIDTSDSGLAPGVTGLNEMVYVALPANVIGNQGGEIDKIYVLTDNGQLIIFTEALNLDSILTLLGTNEDCPTEDPNDPDDNVLVAGAVNTERSRMFILNLTDNTVHVVNTISQTEIDVDENNSNGVTCLCLHQLGPGDIDRNINENIRDIVVGRVQDPPNAARGFITGDLGVTLINATDSDFEVLDAFDTPGENPDDIESIPMSENPNRITRSSQEDGYFYVTNTDGSLSVISAKPFVTISSIDPDTVTQGDPDFTITFQVDELCEGCTYRVRANGDILESGTLLQETAYTAADAPNVDLTTASINTNDFPAGTFIEGENQIFIFSDDASGLTGRDSISLTIDQPPPDVEILSTAFGNTRGFVTIRRLTQEDIKQYNIFVLEALDQANPTCPGGLDFAAASPTAAVAQPGDGSEVKITITGLTNGVAYCVGVQAEDNAGNKSANITVAADPIIPEVTIGIAGASGETGCSLSRSANANGAGSWLWPAVLGMGVLLFLRFFLLRRRVFVLLGSFALALAMMPLAAGVAYGVEATDQHWSAQFQGGFFLPTDDVLQDFLGTCCNPMFTFTFGRLFKNKYEVNLGVGFMSRGGTAIGIDTGRESGENFNFTVVPISNSFIYRADYKEDQILVPYAGAGFDYLYFRENLQGDVTSGFKFGYHAMGGLQILLDPAGSMEEFGINDVYLTLEGKWQQIDNFGGSGLAFNGFTMAAGLLFEF